MLRNRKRYREYYKYSKLKSKRRKICRLSRLDESSWWLDVVGKISKLEVTVTEAAHKTVLGGEK